MHKGKLVEAVVDATNYSEKLVGAVIESTIKSIALALESRNHVILPGFGTFRLSKRSPTRFKHPRTGELVRLEARLLPAFKPSRRLKARVAAKRHRGRPKKR